MTDPNDPGKPNENETPDPAPNPDPAPTPDPAPEPQPGDKGASSEEVQQALKALAEIHKKMAAGEAPRPGQTPEQIREQIREQTGWNDAQIDFHQNTIVSSVAPLQEELSWMKLRQKHADLDKVEDLMKKELNDGYSPVQRANPAILEKVYYLAKGRLMEQNPTPAPSNQNPNPNPARRPAPAYNSHIPGNEPQSRTTQLTAEQREYARRMGLSEEQYRVSSTTKKVKELKRA